MSNYFQFIPFLLFYSLYYSTLSPAIQYSHPHHQNLLLLTFKQSFTIDQSNSDYISDPTYYYLTSNDYICQPSYPKTKSWNESTDCCSWDGVTCDKITGNVVELDLSCSQLGGSIHSNSTLFLLPHLRSLNLAYNRISASKISMFFGNFSQLEHLNLSNNVFSGQVPSEIFKLTELTTLDLSDNAFTIGPDIFKLLLTNFTKLSQVSLPHLNIFSSIPNNLSSSLEVVQLSYSNLHGKLPDSIFHLPNLKTLDLRGNSELYGLLPSVRWNSHTTLEWLDLSGIQFSGKLPDSIGNLKALKRLRLRNCGFSGTIKPSWLLSLSSLQRLDLGFNQLSGPIPMELSSLVNLQHLYLGFNQLSGPIPMKLSTLVNLQVLYLDINQLSGPIPMELSSLVNLQVLHLGYNQLSGPIPMELSSLVNLQQLDLIGNQLSGPIPIELFSLVNLQELHLGFNQLSGPISMELSNLVNLQGLDLRGSQLSGPIPMELFSLVNLQELYLGSNQLSGSIPKKLSSLVNLINLDISSNNLSGHVDVNIFSNMKQLQYLDLSHNRLSLVSKKNSTLPASIQFLRLASCNITELEFLRSTPKLFELDLSRNNIKEVPSWLWSKCNNSEYLNISYNSISHTREIHFQQIETLDIRSNLFQGQLPQVSATIRYMFISNNKFSGMIPSSIVCRLTNLQVFDLSNNSFTGSIPQCIGNMSQSLSVLDMHKNEFEGTIPSNISSRSLTTLNLQFNHLRGNIPSSLAECVNLKVLDLGNNNFNASFPSWLGVLPNLTVLNLRSNRFHGKILLSPTSSFSKLQILDLSRNQFIGTLPPMVFQSFSSMMEIHETSKSASYMGDDHVYYKDSTTLVNKGIETELVRILTTWTTIDLSFNNFEGNIPNSVGSLRSLRQLNFSNNRLTGEIPISFENLSVLESLDISSNQLTGKIPTQLAALHFLSKLNLSNNHLTGRIPNGPQFQTFENGSYINNDGLCGIPLSETCGGDKEHVVGFSHDSDFIDGFSWRSVVVGYGVGMVLGLGIGALMMLTETPKWLIIMVEEEGYRIQMKRNRKKKIFKQTGRKN